ncbi:MAG: hypothetical protein JWN46_1592 [Acidimicrobiales bacterium]|nr:hypothetical protein [Acidimicrobiales bacterium]
METQTPGSGAPEPASTDAPMTVPPVVVVVVTHDPGDWFRETLESLADQTYPDLSVLVIDAKSAEDPTPLVAEVLPGAYVRRSGVDAGFGAAANQALGMVEGAAFYVLCHDDIALEPDTIRLLVEEAFRSNAGIVGPKLVQWDDPRRLLQVGMNADKTGNMSPIAERGELDQEQHDAVRDVFVVPGACTLVRADLFSALGGYDPAIDYLGDDLDLCWRGHVAGARVLIAPQARVRHLEALGQRRGVDDRRRQLARHRLRTMLACYGPWHRARVLPQAALIAVVEALFSLIVGRAGQARDVLGAWVWNLRRYMQVRSRRKLVRRIRRVSDHEVRGFQVTGSARVSAYLRGQIGGGDDRLSAFSRSGRQLAGSLRQGPRRTATIVTVVVLVLLTLSSRNLLFGRIPAVGEFAQFPSGPLPLLREWVSGWRTAGLGSTAPQPTGYGILGVLGMVFLGAMGLLRKVLILGMLPIGAAGAWRLARPIGSRRATMVAFVVYVAIPVPYNALARGSWSGLLLYAASPWMLLALARASRMAPYGARGVKAGTGEVAGVDRRLVGQVLGLGILLALVATVVPFVLGVVGLMAVGLTIGSLVCFRFGGVVRILFAAIGASLIAVLLHLPWSTDLIRPSSQWEAFAGIRTSEGGVLSLGRLMRFQSGPFGAPPLGWAFLLAAALPVIIGRSWRLEWAVRAWFLALTGWGVVWAGQEGWLPVGLPSAEILLAPVAAALALSAALGMAAFETDLRAYRFGWRQALSVGAALGVVLGSLPLASGLVAGNWKMPDRDFDQPLARLFAERQQLPFRVLWLGRPDVLPLAGFRLDRDVAYATTDRGAPTVRDLWAGSAHGPTHLIADAVARAERHDTTRLGRLLAPMGVRYLVLPFQLAPVPFDRDPAPPPRHLLDTLGQQLDLAEVPVNGGVLVYRNMAWAPSRSVLPNATVDRSTAQAAVAEDLSGAVPALTHDSSSTTATGQVPRPGDLLVATAADRNWKLRVDGVPVARSTTFGWANQFTVARAGSGRLTYSTPLLRYVELAGQVLLWVLALGLWRRYRRIDRTGPR